MPNGYAPTPRARRGLYVIAAYGRRHWSAARLDCYLQAIQDQFDALGESPKIGLRWEALIADVRTSFVGTHVIVYRSEEPIEVVRVLHQSSDWSAIIGLPSP